MFGIFGMISYLFGGVVADMVSTRKLMSTSLILTGLGGLLHLMNPSYIMLLAIYALWGFFSVRLLAFAAESLREIANENEQSKAYGFMDGGRGIVSPSTASVSWPYSAISARFPVILPDLTA